MKKWIRNSVLFFLLVAVAYPVLVILWGELLPVNGFKKNLIYVQQGGGFTGKRLQEVKNTSEVDVLFLGSSVAYRGLDTRFYTSKGLKVFNLGTSSQTPLETQLLLDRYLQQLQPKLVVYAVSPEAFSGDGVESALDLIANDSIQKDMYSLALRLNNMKVYNTLIYAQYKQLMGNHLQQHPDSVNEVDRYILGGFTERKMEHLNPPIWDTMAWTFQPEQIESFDTILAAFATEEIPVILVHPPLSPSFYKAHTNNAAFDRLMEKRGTYQNYNTILSLKDTLHFYDELHLNQDGVELFNQHLYQSKAFQQLLK
ncbi:MAG: hypothetical protein CL843_04380 [Crocinitomicaceae bacterium]|nr:hypothetical protein [Crocinitomicaceae bacterium]|tara:strand:- start:6497 stop:7432 length:936 start_codon:yes stop_codon:yes gene_type:complete